MKTKLLAIALLFVGTIMSCSEDQALPTDQSVTELQNQSDVVRLTNVRNRIQELMSLGTAQRLNSAGRQSESGRSAASNDTAKSRFSMARTESDSTDWDDGDWDDEDWEDYESCAAITETENADGSYTIVEDYGVDGCEEYGVLVKGKITENFSYSDGVETFETIYEGFSYDGVTMNGVISGTFTWDENEVDSMNYAYSSSWVEDLTITFDDGESYSVKSDFSEEYTVDKLVMTGSYEGEESNGDTFSFVITEPLIYDFSCDEEEVFVPVQGIESVTYNDEVFSIDYGSGACDNLATITENGESYEIDLAKEWAEECGDHEDTEG